MPYLQFVLTSIFYISDGNCRSFMSGSQDQTILLCEWDLDKNEVECIHSCRGHAGSVECVAVQKSGQKVG